MQYQLDDILDSERVQELLARFHGLTGLHSGIVDAQGNLRATSGQPGECLRRTRHQKIPGYVCLAMNPEKALENLPESGHRLLESGQGLYYAIHPLRLEGRLVGVLYLCQFRIVPEEQARDADAPLCRNGRESSDIPAFTATEMDQVMGFFAHLVRMLSDMGLSRTALADRQADLQLEQERFQALFQATGDPFIMLDTSRIILDFNSAAEQQFGYSREELLGMHVETLHVSPARSEEFGRLAYAAMARHGSWRGEWPLRKKSGDIFTGEVTITLLPGEQGRPVGTLAIIRDVTQRKRLAEEREMALAEMEAIFENSLIGVALLRNRAFSRINRRGAEIFGYLPEELEGLGTLDIHFTRATYEEEGRNAYQTLAEQGWYSNEVRLRKKDGSAIWVRTNLKAIDPADPEQGVIWAFDDVTEHHAMEQDLARAKEAAEEASRSKSLFLASMSHEIRTPLSGVLSMLQLVREENLPPELTEHLDAALSAGQSLLSVVGDVIDLSRVESGHVELAREPLDPADLANKALDAFRPQARQKGIELVNAVEPGLPRVLGDEGRIRQTLFNLISNAVKHTDSGSVTVQASLRPGGEGAAILRFCVEDTGEGIPEDQLDQVFKTFVRAKGQRSERQGSGLGLAIVRNLVELMRGEVHLESTPGQGTTVCMSLPLALAPEAGPAMDGPAMKAKEVPPAATTATPAPQPGSQPGSASRVLVVEDNRVNQIAVRRFLERRGYDVTCVGDGAEAVQAVQDENYGIVLMDIQMPGMDGEEATRRIRAMDKGRDLPIVALTAYAMKGDRERFLEQGMNDYLPKPVDMDLLTETVARWMGPAPEQAQTAKEGA